MVAYKRLDVNEVGDVTVVRFRDRKIVEDINIQQLGQEMFRLIEVENRDKLLLNFSSVDFLSSAALGKLIALRKKLMAKHGMLKLSAFAPMSSKSLSSRSWTACSGLNRPKPTHSLPLPETVRRWSRG
jgi:anti-sigma B factor antagonist